MRIEVPVEDMARIGEPIDIPSGATSQGTARTSIWSAIHPRLLQLVREHRSTLLFVNSRRIAERLASALNELAGEPLVRAHHGSLARAQRVEIEDELKAGRLRGLVATSSLELGIDMGAIDLVVQIEAPPSVASGLQRIGRASHQVDAVSRGIVFPKYRGDLVACAAVARSMHDGPGRVDALPAQPHRRPRAAARRDGGDGHVGRRRAVSRPCDRAAPFASLSRTVFDGVLDMLAGRYPSDEFAELRPRLTWDRVKNTVVARESAKRVAVVNGGTIPDRGLYGVFLAGAEGGAARVGELDEEMVFESRVGETFLLGASTWRIEEITHDRVTCLAGAGRARARCRSGRATAPAAPSSSAGPSARSCARLAGMPAGRRRGPPDAAARPRPARGREPARVPRRPARGDAARCPTTARSSSSGVATNWATGACACSRRSAGGC